MVECSGFIEGGNKLSGCLTALEPSEGAHFFWMDETKLGLVVLLDADMGSGWLRGFLDLDCFDEQEESSSRSETAPSRLA